MPDYSWVCHVCSASNVSQTETCANCGSPASLNSYEVSRRRSQLASGQLLSDDSPALKQIPPWLPNVSPIQHPSLLRRYVGSLIDVTFIIALIGVASRTPLYHTATVFDDLALLAILVVYEPFLTAYFCTIGQAVMRFRVRDLNTGQRVPLWRSYIRFIVKWPLGLISFVTLPARNDRRAIHDLVASSIVVESQHARRSRALTIVRADAQQAARRST